MVDSRKFVIVILQMEDQNGFHVVLMHSINGEINWDIDENFILTTKPTHEEAEGYARDLADIIRYEVLEIRRT
jgi:hypothetical protein